MKLHLIKLKSWSIHNQLKLEEALLRADTRNYCIINDGSDPSIVMGISGKQNLLINEDVHLNDPIPIIRRFSGGGTVVVDQNTLFVTFICNSKDVNVPCFPDQIMCWSKPLYEQVFNNHLFQVQENDYSFGTKKFGGNAQYLCKERWLHHTSFLWDFDQNRMNVLKLPPKMPNYRKSRSHNDFLTRLKDHLPSKDAFQQKLRDVLGNCFDLEELTSEELEPILKRPHRSSTKIL